MRPALLLLTAVLVTTSGHTLASEAPVDPIPVHTIGVIEQDIVIEERRTGVVKAHKQVNMVARASGLLLKKHFNTGDSVQAGDVLYELDATDYQLAKDILLAELAVAETKVAASTRDHNRAMKLGKSLSMQQRDEVITAMELAKGELQILKAQLGQVEQELSRTVIKAPMEGRVGEQPFDEGSLIQIGSVLTKLVNDDKVEFALDIDERTLAEVSDDLRLGQASYHVWLELLNGELLPEEGEVISAENEVDPQTGTMKINFVFANNGQVFPGQFATLLVKRVERGVLVPQQAIIMSPQGNHVLLLEHGHIVSRPVELGENLGDERQVMGLEGDEILVVSGQQKLEEGMAATAAPESSEVASW